MYFENTRGGTLARMVDLNSDGAALLLDGNREVWPGQEIELGLMYPKVVNGSFDIVHSHTRATVYRSEGYNNDMKRIVVRFNQPLADAPAVGNEYIYQ
jgi:hypothetical protein